MKSKINFFLYVAAGFVFYLFWLYWVFPSAAIRSRIIAEIENRSQGQYKVDVGKMDFSFFGSVTVKDLKVSQRLGSEEQVLIKTPKFKLGFSPFAIFSKKPDFSFYLKGSKGDLEGAYRRENDEMDLQLIFDQFPISDLQFIAQKTHLGFKGNLDGKINIRLSQADPNRNAGSIDLELQNISMDSTKINLDPTSPEAARDLPPIKITGGKDSVIQGEIRREDLHISHLVFQGGDIDLNMTGKVSLQGPDPKNYKLALQGNFKVSEGLAKALPPEFSFLESQKSPDGSYPLSLTGRLGHPDIRINKFKIPY